MATKKERESAFSRNKPFNGYFYLLIEIDIQSQAVIPVPNKHTEVLN